MGADFFDQDTFPTAVFAADILRNGDTLTADGTLTIKGAAVPVSLPFDLTINGDQAQMNGSLTLDRRDFTVGESMADESNLGFDVMVDIAVTATR
jgi:polyisoprenoid-binding protein YceI